MATVVNFIDVTLRGAAARTVNLASAQILLTPSAPAFHVSADGVITPPSITFTATRIDVDAPLTFNATGAPLANVTAESVTITGASMTGSSVTVIASATVNGQLYTGPCTISKFSDGKDGKDAADIDLSPGALKEILEGQLTTDELDGALRGRIGLIDAGADTAGSVAARVKYETDQRIAAISQASTDNRTYVQQYTYSQQTINDSFSAFGTNIQAAYQGYANGAADGALAAAKSFAQSYSYSKADADSSLTATANQLRSEFATLNQGTGATVAWVQDYAYSKAQANDAIASATQQLSTTVAGHTSTLEIQGNSISGLGAQYTVKIDNNSYVSGFGLASTPINGVPTSSFIVLADRFAVGLPGQAAKYPFVIGTVNGQQVIGLRGDVVLDGTFTFRDASGKPLLGIGVPLDPAYAAPGTLNSEQSLDALGYGAQFIGRGIRVDGNTLTKTGADGNWNSDARSKEGFIGGAYTSAIIDVKCEIMFGLTTDPDWNFSYDSIDFALYTNLTGGIFHYQNGVEKGLIGNYVVGDCLSMQYDGTNIVMMKNGTVLTGVNPSGLWPASVTAPLFFDSSFVTTGTSLSGVRFGAMSSNNWANVGGTDKPQDNATVGAPSGTYVGGTEAGLVASRALNGDSAFNALPGIGQQIDDRLSKTSASDLAARVTLQTGGALLAGTSTNGSYHDSTGFYGVQGGVVKFSCPISGDPTFGGKLTAAYGSFGSVAIAAGGSLSLRAGAFNADPGIWMGDVGGVPKFSIVAANGAKLIYDPTLANPLQLVNVATATDYIYSVQINTGGSSPIFNLPRRNEQFAGTYIASSNAPNVTSRSWRVTTAGLTAARLAVSADGTQATLYVNANGLTNEDGVDFYVYCDFVAGGTTHTGGSLVTCIFT